ncbi:uracil-DNA-glycosidase [Suid gammaherpesvirus 3]|uniref:Uracil-DNA-glycosidase n=1 Tax=Suid gammaherpesvirus 3 TaxID=1960249 RepID=Q8JYB7_9GAMA|nr:uracil-DNA-glycosidase [Porcine lymphotropic herpesvirus 1]AAM22145.1 uracil-DNA-glycosidase [Porcine lymphotropic herpesvirus 1]
MDNWLKKNMWPALLEEHIPDACLLISPKWLHFLDLSPFLKHKLYCLIKTIETLRNSCIIYPPKDLIMAWSYVCEPQDIKVVILGQDPYHGGQANGYAFSVNKGLPIPHSLRNIYTEVASCYPKFYHPDHGCLESWAKQGVLLLNTVLTVEAKKPGSHSDIGWAWFTNHIITCLSDKLNSCVFMLWGSKAILKSSLIDSSKHLVLKSQHPSPLAAKNSNNCHWPRFLGCGHFLEANKYLTEHGKSVIDWTIV